MSLPVFDFMRNDTIYTAPVRNGGFLCHKADRRTGAESVLRSAYPAGGNFRGYILGGEHAGRV